MLPTRQAGPLGRIMVTPEPKKISDLASETSADSYDVVILGGAFSGAAFGLILKRERPHTSVLIIEKCSKFDRKVGESTSEVGGCFLTKVLGMTHYLSGHHYQKHGLRLWFDKPENECPGRCSEVGAVSQSRLPTYQLDRSLFDQHLLETAADAGCEVLRPATVKDLGLKGAGNNVVTVKHEGATRTIQAGWVVDCSGRAALIARHRGTIRRLDDHPVHSMWVRFRNVRDLDSYEARSAAPALQERTWAPRGTATNHLMGHGWWAWLIPLSNGDFSAGITWDERMTTPPEVGPVGDRVKQALLAHPIGKLMFEDAEPIENDARIYKHLPYYSTETAGDGWLMAGDSAGFLDPLYSQGLDFSSFAVYGGSRILLEALDGQCVRKAISDHDHAYRRAYELWFDGVYRDKYEYLGDAEIMRAAFLLDIGAYFLGPVRLVYNHLDREFRKMPFSGPIGLLFGKFMALYNRRLVKIARKRLARGTYGRRNTEASRMIRTTFSPSPRSLVHLLRGIAQWAKLELQHAFIRTPRPGVSSTESELSKVSASQ